MTPIVFLDMDGVLVTRATCGKPRQDPPYDCYSRVDPACVAQLNRITDATGAVIVVSSSWRHGSERRFQKLKVYLADMGVHARIIGRTPQLSGWTGTIWVSKQRGDEIQDWISAAGADVPFVILDDESDMAHLKHRLVQTTFDHGLTREHADAAIAMLSQEVPRVA